MAKRETKGSGDGIYTREKSPYYWASYIDQSGKRIRCSTGIKVSTDGRKEAVALLAKWKTEAFQSKAWGVDTTLHGFEEVMLEYLNGSGHLKGIETLKYQTKNLLRFFKGRSVEHIVGQDIKAYCRFRQNEGVANSTINRELSAFSAAINYCKREHEWNLPNMVVGRKLKEPPHRDRYLSRAEVASLVNLARKRRRGDMLADFIILAVNTGCRSGELLNMEWSRVILEPGRESLVLNREHTKAGKPRMIPLNVDALSAVRSRLRFRAEKAPQSSWVFARYDGEKAGGISQAFRRLAKDAGIDDIRVHDLRHTAASWLVTDGVPLEVVKDLLGHSSITMTERYAHLNPERVREAVMGLRSSVSHISVTPDQNIVQLRRE